MPSPPSGNKNKSHGYSNRVCVARSSDHKKSATAEPDDDSQRPRR